MSDCVVNIVVGRFQSPMLTGDQRDLLDRALQGSDGGVKPVVVMGLSPLRCTASNPLDYESRIAVVEAEYPGKFNFRYIKDQNSDKVWSENFDKLVKETLATSGRSLDVKVLGSKDGFYNHYVGEFKDKFEEFTQTTYISVDEQAKMFSRDFKCTPEWRFGVAYAMSSQYPTVYPTVDCAIFDKSDFKRVYLAKKKNEELYRFVGGFASPSDHSFEESALREAREETCLECSNVEYVCSMRVDDYRYRNEASKVVTHLFTMVKSSGRAKASDDICELKLFDVGSITSSMVQSEHRPLLEKLQEHLKSRASA